MDNRPIEAFLRDLGLEDAAAQATARTVLERAGFTRAPKRNMAREKEERAARVIHEALAFHCGAESCRTALAGRAGGRVLVQVARSACEVCQGSANRQATEEMRRVLREAGLTRLLVVGGSPALHTELRAIAADGLEWRFVEGTSRVNSKTANQDLAWAQVVIIWGGSTELDHKVSRLYSESQKAFTVPRRGIAALAQAVQEHVARR